MLLGFDYVYKFAMFYFFFFFFQKAENNRLKKSQLVKIFLFFFFFFFLILLRIGSVNNFLPYIYWAIKFVYVKYDSIKE